MKPSASGICCQLLQRTQSAAGSGAGALWEPDPSACSQAEGVAGSGQGERSGLAASFPSGRYSRAAGREALCSVLLLFKPQVKKGTMTS